MRGKQIVMKSKNILVFLNYQKSPISILIWCLIFLFSCRDSTVQRTNVEENTVQRKLFVKDSINHKGDTIFSNFYLGMSKKEYISALESFNKETNGYISIEGLHFKVDSIFDDGKLSCLGLWSVEEVNPLSPDRNNDLIKRYTHRFGDPDLLLDEDFQKYVSNKQKLENVVWIFDNRVFNLHLHSFLTLDDRISKSYILYYYTPQKWEREKQSWDKYYMEKVKVIKEKEEKSIKYTNEI